ncbi:MAG: hypothetical protein LBJ00_06880 [Planctomycetaceae bacterium]|nr:hypothetical protein [Planctomycetaceae bacterium]
MNNIEPFKTKRNLSLRERTDKMTGEIKPESEVEETYYFTVTVMDSSNSKNEILVHHGDEIIVLSSLTFDLLRRQNKTPDELEKLARELDQRFVGKLDQARNHKAFIYDSQSRLKQITWRFDVDDYLIIKPNNNVTGTPKGLKRFIPNK